MSVIRDAHSEADILAYGDENAAKLWACDIPGRVVQLSRAEFQLIGR